MTRFYIARMEDGDIMLTIDDDKMIYQVPITDGEFDQLMIEMCMLIESEPNRDLVYAVTA